MSALGRARCLQRVVCATSNRLLFSGHSLNARYSEQFPVLRLGLVGSTLLLLLLMRTIGGGIARRCAMWHENTLSHSPCQV